MRKKKSKKVSSSPRLRS